MPTADVHSVKAHLPEIIASLSPGEQLVIEQDGEPIATLTRRRLQQWPCKAGSAKNEQHWMASDFDAPLEEFREYME